MPNIKRVIVSALICGLTCNMAKASEWLVVAESGDATLYMDVKSIRFNNGLAKIWEMFDYKTAQQVPGTYPIKSYFSEKDLRTYNCKDRTSGLLQYTSYSGHMGGGEAVESGASGATVTMREIVPDSVGEAAFEAACAKH